MSENTKKLLEYTGIGILILILLWLLLSKKANQSQQPLSRPQQSFSITPAVFNQPAPQNFAGIPMFNLIPEQFNYYQMYYDLIIKPTESASYRPAVLSSCGICLSDNKLNDYVWGGKSGTA